MELDISAVFPPPGINGQFLSRRETGSDWSTMPPGVDVTSQDAGTNHSIREINALLQDTSLDICIDYGAFGTCYLARSLPEPPDSVTVRIPQTVRTRIIWFCTVARSYAAARKRPFEIVNDEA